MPSKEKAEADAYYNSSRISETSRIIGFGLLATYYAVKINPSDSFSAGPCLLLFVGLGGFLAVVFDYLQYVFGYLMARAALRDEPEYRYNQGISAVWFSLKSLLFVAKQGAAVVGSAALVWLLFVA